MKRFLIPAMVFYAALSCAATTAISQSAQQPDRQAKDSASTISQGYAGDDKTHVSLHGFADDRYTSPDTTFLGGAVQGRGAHIILRCQPIGFYDTGVCLDLQMTGRPWTSSRPGVNSGFERGLPALAADPDMDSVSQYNGVSALPPVLTLQNVSYTANKIMLPKPLTPAQIAQVQPSMWVLTNSIDPTVKNTQCEHCVPTINVYGSYVTGVSPDGSYIRVSGWTVPGSGHTKTGQVPGARLDRARSDYPTQTAFLGAPTNAFARNTVLAFDPENVANAGWQTTNFQADEIDMFDFDKVDYRMQFQGITVAFRELGVVPAARGVPAHSVLPSQDSYDMDLAGPTPTLLKLDGAPTANYIIGNSVLVKGNAGVSAKAGDTALMFENDALTGGVNNLRLEAFLLNDKGLSGYSGTSLHYGLTVDGRQGTINRPQSQLIFDGTDTGTGGVSLWGFNGKGLSVNSAGVTTAESGLNVVGVANTDFLTVHNNVTVGVNASLVMQSSQGVAGGAVSGDRKGDVQLNSSVPAARVVSMIPVQLPSHSYANLPATGHAGSEVFCTNCLKPSERAGAGTGMVVFDDGHSRWITTAGAMAAE